MRTKANNTTPKRSAWNSFFAKYLQPTWYFNLLPQEGGTPYLVDWRLLSEEEKAVIDFDGGYSTESISLLDAAYQAWHKGIIRTDPAFALGELAFPISVKDNYRFVRKYYHPVWSLYIFLLRIFSGRNPIREFAGLRSASGVKRQNMFAKVYRRGAAYENWPSPLLREKPRISVIIPTLNRYPYLRDGLADLERQEYRNFDVIVVDQSEPFQSRFYDEFQLDLTVIRQKEKALWLARNEAIRRSGAEWLLLFDDDSRVGPGWIAEHLKCADYFQAEISSGVSISEVGSKVPPGYAFLKWSDQLDTGNVLIHRRVFADIGLFDRQFEKQRMGDGEFGLRAYLGGYRNISNNFAQRLHLKVGQGGLRQMGSWDAYRPRNFIAPRPIPSVLYLFRKYFGRKAAWLSVLKNVPPSIVPYRFKRSKHLLLLGSLLSVFLMPLVIWQVARSWRAASRKLTQGARIEKL